MERFVLLQIGAKYRHGLDGARNERNLRNTFLPAGDHRAALSAIAGAEAETLTPP
jgi:hypothetical protein